jgi:diaminopimelate decarboxylase
MPSSRSCPRPRRAKYSSPPMGHAPKANVEQRSWWERAGLEVRSGRLTIAGRDAERLARDHGTPAYVHDLVRVEEQARALQAALAGAGLDGRVRLALKAQRAPELLRFLRALGEPGTRGGVGLDVCSPGEMQWGIEHGWEPGEVSYTGTNLSDRDLDAILAHPGVHLNVDLITQLERVGRRAPGRTIGIRVNPRGGAGFEGDGQTLYSGPRPTKFGIFPEQLGAALAVARRHDLTIDTVHCHVGDGYLNDGLPAFEEVVRRVADMVRFLQGEGCPIAEVNTGGGLGVTQRSGDEPLDLGRWAAILARHLGQLGVEVGTEPGDFLVKECAIHLAEVVTVEERDGLLFVGVDTGWNVMAERFVYRALLDIVLCRAVDATPAGLVTISGHINEGDDLFAEDLPFPEVREGDVVAAINVGSYNASMASEHCLRPPAASVFFTDRI